MCTALNMLRMPCLTKAKRGSIPVIFPQLRPWRPKYTTGDCVSLSPLSCALLEAIRWASTHTRQVGLNGMEKEGRKGRYSVLGEPLLRFG